MMAIGGGYPIRENGMLIGTIGMSGGSAEQDVKVATDALRAAGFSIGDRAGER